MQPLVLYQYPGLRPGGTLSPPCAKVHMALAFKGLRHETVDLRTPWAVRRLNPRGRVPILRMGQRVVADSREILDALDERFADNPLLPESSRARAEALVWESCADDTLYFYLVWLRWRSEAGYRRLRAVAFARFPAVLRRLAPAFGRRIALRRLRGQGLGLKDEQRVWTELEQLFDALDTWLGDRPFVAGDEPSRGDLALCAAIDQFAIESLTPRAARAVADRDRIEDWRGRVHDLAPPAV